MKFAAKKVDRLAQPFNFGGFALYAIRRALKFDEIVPWTAGNKKGIPNLTSDRVKSKVDQNKLVLKSVT